MIIGFVVWTIAAFIFLGIGISCRRSKEAVGFFTFVKAPIVENVKDYNRAVSILWFAVSIIFEITGIPFLFFEQNSPVFIFIALAVMVLIIGMMVGYCKIERKYRKNL